MSELSTKIYKINWKYVFDHALDRQFWKKSWDIFQVDGVKFTLHLVKIAVSDNTIMFKIKSNTGYWDYGLFELSMDPAHFNEEVFNNKVYGTARRLLMDIEEKSIQDLPSYEMAKDLDRALEDASKQELREEICDDLGLSEDSLTNAQEDIVSTYVDTKLREIMTNREQVLTRLRGIHHRSRYGLLALTLGNEKDYEAWLGSYGDDELAIALKELNEEFDVEEIGD